MNKLSHDELKERANEILADLGDYMFIDEIHSVNHDPHPYMIGNSHVSHASDNWGGMLGTAAIEDLERRKGPQCYWKGQHGDRGERCKLPYHKHTSDTVAFMRLRRDLTNKEAHIALLTIKPLTESNGLDGWAFVDDGFRIAEPTEEQLSEMEK